jgi:CheY-like chemotaxis protein
MSSLPGRAEAIAPFPDKPDRCACRARRLVLAFVLLLLALAKAEARIVGRSRSKGQIMTKHGTILLIEEDADDLLRIKKGLVEAEVLSPLQTVHSCEDAVKYLSGMGIYENRESFPMPFLVILDLALPGEGGFGVLRWLYDRPGLRKQFTVLVLGTPGQEHDVQLAYELGAQSFLMKPGQYRQLVETLRHVKEYWINLNRLPGDMP